jgi:hypothetical protein
VWMSIERFSGNVTSSSVDLTEVREMSKGQETIETEREGRGGEKEGSLTRGACPDLQWNKDLSVAVSGVR